MRKAENIEYAEFFDIGDKVFLYEKFGVIVQTHKVDNENFITNQTLIVRWDTNVDGDYENLFIERQRLLKRVSKEHKFKYINEDGTKKN